MRDATLRSAAPPPVLRSGSGEPVLLVHGFLLNWQSWGAVVDELATEFEVLAPTLPGHWGGPESDVPVTLSTLADHLEQVMDEAGWSTAHVVGNSIGGWLALELAARGRARSVTAVAPAGIWRTGSRAAPLLRRKFRGFSWAAPAGRLLRSSLLPTVVQRSLLGVLAHRPDRIPPNLATIALESPLHCTCIRLAVEDPAVMLGCTVLHRITVPATILFCEQDRVIPPQHYGRRLIEEIPAISAKTLPDVGHVPMLEAPDLISREIRASIGSASGRAELSA